MATKSEITGPHRNEYRSIPSIWSNTGPDQIDVWLVFKALPSAQSTSNTKKCKVWL